ncbi:flagellar hook-associated protein FlgL [Rubrivivax sp. RP6-9]|uniref:flagellar hook-associated protein FlgL n=1 Tax=Rubrivivax sp. RP6-9 TaxID=3415750 RepID=UPI003CC64CF9
MRITAANAFESSIGNLQKRQQELSQAQDRLTSGKRVATASDDPVAAARAERALAAMVRAEANQRALEASRNVMQQAETAMGDAGELLQQARELVLNAGNGSYADADRKTLANALRGIREQLLSVANRNDGAGSYVFAGQGTDSPPFVDTPAGVVYRGAAGQSDAPSDEPLPLSVDGQQTWLGAPAAVAGDPALSVFGVLDRVIGQLGTPGLGGDVIKQAVSDGVRDIDALSNNLGAQRAAAGEMLNRTDSVEARISAAKLAAQTDRSLAEDLDMVQAISDFQNKQSGYDAALKTYSLVQKQSLFQYISA